MKSAVHACVWKTVASIADVDQKVWGDHAINCCYVLSGVVLRVKLFDNGQGPQPLSRHLLVAWTDTYWPISWFPLLQVFLYVSKAAWLDWKWLSHISLSVWESVKTRKLMGDSLCSLLFMSDWQIKCSLSQFTSTHRVSLWRCAVTWERKSPQIDANVGGWISRYTICLLFLIFAKQRCVIHKGSILFSMAFNLNINNSFQARKVWRAKTRRHCIQGNRRENGRFHCTWHADTSITFKII